MKNTLRTMKVLVCCLLTAVAILQPQSLQGETISQQFPKESLVVRLEKLAAKTKQVIVYDPTLLENTTVQALNSKKLSVEQIIEKSLAGTTLAYKVTSDNSIVILNPTSNTEKKSESKGKGRITGKVTDEQGVGLPGATIQVLGTNKATLTDMNGKYNLTVPAGKYSIEAKYVSYQKQRFDNIKITPNQNTSLSVTLKESSISLKDVVVTGQQRASSTNALLLKQKEMSSMTDGLSADLIRKTSDNNMAQVLKRVAGVTIQDNKFVTVRGMSERYNNVQLNGTSMPSTEPNRRNFSFDIIPSALVDNVTVAKTFTPDMQGEFTGGMVEISTLAIPKKNFFNLTLGTGMNTNSTGKEFKTNKRFTSDYFLGNASERNWYGRDWINSEYASYLNSTGVAPEYAEKAYTMNANIPNHWGLNSYTAAPLQNYALSMGKSIDLGGGNTLGATLAATYRHEENVETIEYAHYRSGVNETQNAHNYKFTTAVGAVANIGWERPGHKITLRNLFNNRYTHDNIERAIYHRDNGNYDLEQYSSPMRNTLWQSRLEGEHKFWGGKLILTWFGDYNKLERSQPEDRLIRGGAVSAGGSVPEGTFPDIPLVDGKYSVDWTALFNHSYAVIGEGYIMNSKLNETKKNGGGNLEFPFTVGGNVQKLKAGYWGTFRTASYTQQFITITNGTGIVNNSDLTGLSLHEVMSPENFANGFILYRIGASKGNQGDYYNGRQTIHATYLMGDFSFFHKLHLTGGVRIESANTEVDTRYGFYKNNQLMYPDTTIIRPKTDWLPALTLIYNITDKINIRGAVSKTLARPDFRELTPYNYYNANDRLEVASSQALETTYTDNYDLRLEWYPQSGELLSLSAFYKYFISPVEMLSYNPSGAGNFVLRPANLYDASIKGLELNVRKSFGFLAPAGFLKDLYLTANTTVLKGDVKYDLAKIGMDPKTFTGTARKRPLQGMSPYAVNAGLDYQAEQLGLALNYGRIGRKLVFAGEKESEDTYEAPRDVIDFQISYRLLGGRIQIKANASDLLNQPVIQYDNFRTGSSVADPDKNYNKGEDLLRSKIKKGTNYSLSVSYNF